METPSQIALKHGVLDVTKLELTTEPCLLGWDDGELAYVMPVRHLIGEGYGLP